MKKLKIRWGVLFLAIGLCMMANNSFGSDSKHSKKERKEERRAELEANFRVLDSLIERKRFVLEADFLENQYGNRVWVPQLLNFIKVDSISGILQTGSNSNLGFNGVGGVTAEGSLERWRVIRNFKSLSYVISFTVMSNIGIYDVIIDINADNNARARISGLSRGELIYDGHFQSVENSRVFKGQSRF